MNQVIGIDLGNKNFVIAVPSNRGIDVLLNESSNRLSPTMVTIASDRRYSGEMAFQKQIEFYKSAITDLKRVVGLEYDSEEREIIEKIVTYNLVRLGNGRTGISVEFQNQTIVLEPEQCIGFLLKSCMKLAKTQTDIHQQCLVSVSPWWKDTHRRSIINSLLIGSIENLGIVNSTTAAAAAYVKTHPQRLPKSDEDPVPYLFIDMGDSSMNVAVVLLKQNFVQILSLAYDEHLGGSHFTTDFSNYLLEKAAEKYKFDIKSNPRALIRFRAGAEKLKKVLSVNPIALFDIPNFVNDIDVSFTVKREELNSTIQDLVSRIPSPIEKALELSGIKKEQIVGIEALGGGARIVAVKEKITQTLGKEPTQTLNLDECFAIGSAYIASSLAGDPDHQLSITDVLHYPINAQWKDGEIEHNEEIFRIGTPIPTQSSFNAHLRGDTIIKIVANNEQIGIIEIKTGSEADVCIKFSIGLSLLLNFHNVTFAGTDNVIESCFHYNNEYTDEILQSFKKTEDEMSQNDEAQLLIDQIRNELEAAIFEAERGINKDFAECFDPSNIENYKKEIDDIHRWYEENEFERLSIDEYKTKIETIKKILEPAKQRSTIYKTLTEEISPFKERAKTLLDNVAKDPKIPNSDLREALKRDIQMYLENQDKALKAEKYSEPTFSSGHFAENFRQLEERYEELKKLPPPKQESSDSSDSDEEVVGYDFWGTPITRRKQKPTNQNWSKNNPRDPRRMQYDDEDDFWGPFRGRRRPDPRAEEEMLRKQQEEQLRQRKMQEEILRKKKEEELMRKKAEQEAAERELAERRRQLEEEEMMLRGQNNPFSSRRPQRRQQPGFYDENPWGFPRQQPRRNQFFDQPYNPFYF